MNKHLYDNGLPFSSILAANLDAIKERTLINKKPSIIIIDGHSGEGKTTLAIQCADYIEGETIKINEHLGMGGMQFLKVLNEAYEKGFKVVIYDEGGDFSRRGALTKLNATLNRVFETYRTYNIIVIITLPSFDYLDSSLIDKGLPRILIHVYNRKNYGNFKGYGLRRMSFMKANMKKLVTKQKAYQYETPNFVGHFKDLSPERSKELDAFTTKGKKEIIESAIVHHEGLVTIKEIAQRFSKTVPWVKWKMNKLNIKEIRTYKKKKYYDSNSINIIDKSMEK